MPQQKWFILTGTAIRRTLFLVLVLTIISIAGAELQSASVPKLMPDLVVKISGPPTANAGDDIGPLIKVLARNIGTATAPGTTGTLDPSNGFMIDVVLSTDMTVPSGFATFSPNFSEDALMQGGRISNTTDLAPGASKLYATGGGIPADTPTGSYYVCARIDSGGKVAELNERNNVSCSRIRIRGSRKPDLVVRVRAPALAKSGSDIGPSVRLVAHNIGTGPAPGTTGVLDPSNGYMIDLVLSTDTNVPAGFATVSPNFSEDVLLQGGRTSKTIDLAPGALKAYPTGAGIPADTPTGIYQLCARIDPGSKVGESNEANNVMCVRIKVIHP
jgi:hypothetical protein